MAFALGRGGQREQQHQQRRRGARAGGRRRQAGQRGRQPLRQLVFVPQRQAGLQLALQAGAQPRHQRRRHGGLAGRVEPEAVGQHHHGAGCGAAGLLGLQQALQGRVIGQRQVSGQAPGTLPGPARQRRARQHHGQQQRQRPAVDPGRGALATACGQAQAGQRGGIGQRQAGQGRRGPQQGLQQRVHLRRLQEGAVPTRLVVEHQATRIQRGHHAQPQQGRAGMQQRRATGRLHVLAVPQPIGRKAGQRGPGRRRLRPAARPALAQPGAQPGDCQAHRRRRRTGPQGLHRHPQQHGQVPGQQTQQRQRQQVDLVRPAQAVAQQTEAQRRRQHQGDHGSQARGLGRLQCRPQRRRALGLAAQCQLRAPGQPGLGTGRDAQQAACFTPGPGGIVGTDQRSPLARAHQQHGTGIGLGHGRAAAGRGIG